MARYPDGLPQTRGQACITDAGLETSLVFIDKLDLPCFAAFPLVDSVTGRKHLGDYFRPFLELAAERGAGFVIDTPTWRANSDWGEKLGYEGDALAEANRRSVVFTRELVDMVPAAAPVIVNGVLGPRGDGYRAEARMTPDEAQAYHAPQIAALEVSSQFDQFVAPGNSVSGDHGAVRRALSQTRRFPIVDLSSETCAGVPTCVAGKGPAHRLGTLPEVVNVLLGDIRVVPGDLRLEVACRVVRLHVRRLHTSNTLKPVKHGTRVQSVEWGLPL